MGGKRRHQASEHRSLSDGRDDASQGSAVISAGGQLGRRDAAPEFSGADLRAGNGGASNEFVWSIRGYNLFNLGMPAKGGTDDSWDWASLDQFSGVCAHRWRAAGSCWSGGRTISG